MSAKIRRLPMTPGNMLASLEGRKTQTRRVMRDYQMPKKTDDKDPEFRWTAVAQHHARYGFIVHGRTDKECAEALVKSRVCPYGSPGSQVVLTETWRPVDVVRGSVLICYKADMATREVKLPTEAREQIRKAFKHGKWMPPMFMQAWMSRAPAEIKNIRVERVRSIDPSDAIAEGIEMRGYSNDAPFNAYNDFRDLWESINAKRPGCTWLDNPWVWVVEYALKGGE